jgi:division protein CdvB (Snf7/Vps24/ESCRT-III family)
VPLFFDTQDAVKIMAKDLVRTRRYVKKFISLRANIQAVSLKIQTLKANNTMAQAMKGVTKAMATMNRQVRILLHPFTIAGCSIYFYRTNVLDIAA